MNHRIVAGLAVMVIVAVSTAVTVAGQQRGRPVIRRAPAPGTSAVIVGRVIDANTMAPIRRAQITASNDERFIDAITDDDGRFELSNLTAGAWDVTVEKGGYFPWHIGQRRPFEIPPRVKLSSRQRLDVDIPLSRGGVISGRVFDETGEPLAGLQVKVYRARMSQGYRRLESVGIADRTDDTGAYRIYGLPPGDYYVTASLRMAPADSIIETTYAPTYYPGTGDLGEAQRIRVGLNTETTAIFPLLSTRHVRVAGTLLTSTGAAADAFVTLVSDSSELGIPLEIGAVTRRGGAFTLADVPPGRYTLTAALRGDGPAESARMPLIVANDDVDGVSLVTERPAIVRGRFVADAGVTRPLPQDVEVTAMAARVNGTVVSHGEGTVFELNEIDQPFTLQVKVPSGWAVKGIDVAGSDVSDAKTVVVPLGQQVDARIVITDRAARVSGTVTKDGQPAKAEIVVFPGDPDKWSSASRYVRRVTSDALGRYRVTGLPAYERYFAVAADYLEDGEQADPDFLERVRAMALSFPLGEAEAVTLDLPLLER